MTQQPEEQGASQVWKCSATAQNLPVVRAGISQIIYLSRQPEIFRNNSLISKLSSPEKCINIQHPWWRNTNRREEKQNTTNQKTLPRNGSHASLKALVRLEKAAETKPKGLMGTKSQVAQQNEGK